MTYNLVKVARAPVMVCLQCPLCCNLVHEATTISECLHTFCRDCICQRLGDGESDCCPICNVNLGCSPLEKLRADHQLDDVQAKIFPVKSKKRRVIDNNVDCDAPAPIKRKERSLSSLGIGAVPPSANPGFVSRRTNSVSRRLLTTRDTCADNEFDDNKLERWKTNNNGAGGDCSEGEATSGNWQEEYGSDDKIGAVSEGNQESLPSAKKEIISDEDRETIGTEALQLHKADHLTSCRKGMLPHGMHEQSRAPNPCSNGGNLSFKLGMYLAERSKISAVGLNTRVTEVPDQPEKFLDNPDKTEPYDGVDQELPITFPVVRNRSGKVLKRRSALAQLAELAVGQAVESSEPTKPSGLRARRARRKIENSKNHAVGDSSDWPSMGRILGADASQGQSSFPPLVKSSTLDKLPVVRKISSSGRMRANIAIAKHDKRNTGFWFSLQASENHRIGDNALPQIFTRYLCIKDGKLPVSIVKKYLVKKLDLKSETEIEITCRGQPVVPNLPLESVQGIWFATVPSLDLLPSLKDVNSALYDSRTVHVEDKSAEDYMMVLTYGRHRRPMIGH